MDENMEVVAQQILDTPDPPGVPDMQDVDMPDVPDVPEIPDVPELPESPDDFTIHPHPNPEILPSPETEPLWNPGGGIEGGG